MGGHIHNCCNFDARPERYEYGFYGYEDWNGEKMRWTMGKSCLSVKAKSNLMGLKVFSAPHNIGENGLEFNLFVNENLIEKIHFFSSDAKTLNYYIPSIKDKRVNIKFEVSDTFNPYRLGLSRDNRDLGVAVSPIKFIEKIPEKGIGFYKMETYMGGQQPILPHGQPLKFRWTGIRASMEMSRELLDGGTLLLMCAHPNIDKEPVVVKIIGDDIVIWNETFTNSLWKKVILQPDKIKDLRVLTFQVSRTWNPKLACISQDSRELGVAVTVLKSGY